MSVSHPPRPLRELGWIVRLGARRWLNRFLAGRERKATTSSSSAPTRRAPTGRRRTVGTAIVVLLAPFMLLFTTCQANQIVQRVVSIGSDVKLVSWSVHNALGEYERKPENGGGGDLVEKLTEAIRRDPFGDPGNDGARTDLAKEYAAHYRAHGFRGFTERKYELFADATTVPWPNVANEGGVVRTFAALFLLVGLISFLISLGRSNSELGRVEWSFEWLFTLPARSQTLFAAKLLEYALLNPMLWVTAFPLALQLYLVRDFGWGAPLLAAGVTVYVALVIAALRLAAETWLRTTRKNLKNLHALLTVVGTAAMFAMLWFASREDLPRFVTALGPRFGLTLTPLSLPAELARSGGAWRTFGLVAFMLAFAGLLLVGSASFCAGLVRSGLHSSQATKSAKRSRPPRIAVSEPSVEPALRVERRPSIAGGVMLKDLKLLARDRNFMVQTLVVPLLIVFGQIAVNRGYSMLFASSLSHAATIAFGLGTYMLAFSATTILSVEGNALWILYTLPQPMHRMLIGKVVMWAVIASLYAAIVLAVGFVFGPAFEPMQVVDALVALAGVAIYAFVASGLGALTTDPLEPDVRRATSQSTQMLYMALAGMFGFALYTSHIWPKCVQVLLSALLAFALWQRLRDRIPYLLDGTSAPPPKLSVSDGLIAAMAFFTLQGIFALMFGLRWASFGATVIGSYALAGLVVAASTVFLLQRARVQNLFVLLGLRRDPQAARSKLANLAIGATAGLLAGTFGLVYQHAIHTIPNFEWLRTSLKDLELSGDERVTFALLAVCCAPLFEEFLFRGVLFRGMQRSIGTQRAILASAAIFAVVHPPVSALPVFVLGLAAALSFQRGGLLLAPIVAHAIYNAMVVGSTFWMTS